jgi:tetratricopeptide (TPR) repeat protein
MKASPATKTETQVKHQGFRSTQKNAPAARVSFLGGAEEKKVDDSPDSPSGVMRTVSKRRMGGPSKNKAAVTEKGGTENGAQPNKKVEEQPPPSKSLLGGIGRRLSDRFGDRRKQGGFVKVLVLEDDEMGAVEDDPVVAIFESRNTQRVRWGIEERVEETKIEVPEKNAANIKHFMSRALFGGNKSSKNLDEEMRLEVAKELEGAGSLVWQSAATPTGPEVVHTKAASKRTGTEIMVSFTEDPKARATVVKILHKARRAEHIDFRYEHAVKYYVKALDILTKAKYPDDHPTVLKTVRLLNGAHHVLSSYNNSANIVKMGIKYEDLGELVRALKMYTIAYRIRRDNFSQNHPSLVVLLNMLGSVQIKRGELKEAMQIYELVLKDSPVIFNADDDHDERQPPSGNLLAKSVTYREMGTIYEQWGNVHEALNAYHKSLECVAEWREAVRGGGIYSSASVSHNDDNLSYSLDNVRLSKSSLFQNDGTIEGGETENGEMEVFLGGSNSPSAPSDFNTTNIYEHFFPSYLDEELNNSKGSSNSVSSRDSYADMDLALTLHQIAQLHRCQEEYAKALDAYEVALRGMKYALGRHHPNVAAVLGNIGNLHKEMGDMDAAYKIYQEVLGLESYRLGLSHPDVAITLHNIATIDAARGNHDNALSLYRKVIGLQKKLFGEDDVAVSVTAACMGDVYERVGELKNAMESYEEAIRIKSAILGRHSLEVSRLLHKLGKLAILRKDCHMAQSYVSRAMLIYRLNKLDDDHAWIVDADRDTADIDGVLALSGGVRKFEC